MISNTATYEMIKEVASRPTRKNSNFLCVVIGLPGSGKSYACLRLGQLITDEINKYNLKKGIPLIGFNERNITFSPTDFMKQIHGDEALPPGSVIIYEEAGTTLDSKDALNKLNKMIAHVIETMRYRRYITFFNLPRYMNLDKTIRCLCHCLIETKKIDRRNNLNYIKPQFLNYNPKIDKMYYKFIKFTHNGKKVKSSGIPLKKPSTILRHKYEKAKHDYANFLYGNIMNELGINKSKNEDKDNDKLKVALTPEQKNAYLFLQENPNMPSKDLAKLLQTTPGHAAIIVRRLRKMNVIPL